MGVLDDFIKVIALNLVPSEFSSPEQLYRHRVLIFWMVVMNTVATSLHIALACGWLSFASPGFAQANEVQNVHEDVLEGTIYSMRKDYCIAQKSGNLAAAQAQYWRVQEKKKQYEAVTGRQFDMYPCELFVLRGDIAQKQ